MNDERIAQIASKCFWGGDVKNDVATNYPRIVTPGIIEEAIRTALQEAGARPEGTRVTAEQIKALHRITPSELDGEELWRRNGEYISLYEVLDLFQERVPQTRDPHEPA